MLGNNQNFALKLIISFYLPPLPSENCITSEGKHHAARQRFRLLHVLQYLTTMNHPIEHDILDKLSQIENEMSYFNRGDDVATKIKWSVYEPILRTNYSGNFNVPIMRVLYDLSSEIQLPAQ